MTSWDLCNCYANNCYPPQCKILPKYQISERKILKFYHSVKLLNTKYNLCLYLYLVAPTQMGHWYELPNLIYFFSITNYFGNQNIVASALLWLVDFMIHPLLGANHISELNPIISYLKHTHAPFGHIKKLGGLLSTTSNKVSFTWFLSSRWSSNWNNLTLHHQWKTQALIPFLLIFSSPINYFTQPALANYILVRSIRKIYFIVAYVEYLELIKHTFFFFLN